MKTECNGVIEMVERLRKLVFEALDNALSGGHFEAGEQCHDMNARELTNDLMAYCADDDLNLCNPDCILPHVTEWLTTNKDKIPK